MFQSIIVFDGIDQVLIYAGHFFQIRPVFELLRDLIRFRICRIVAFRRKVCIMGFRGIHPEAHGDISVPDPRSIPVRLQISILQRITAPVICIQQILQRIVGIGVKDHLQSLLDIPPVQTVQIIRSCLPGLCFRSIKDIAVLCRRVAVQMLFILRFAHILAIVGIVLHTIISITAGTLCRELRPDGRVIHVSVETVFIHLHAIDIIIHRPVHSELICSLLRDIHAIGRIVKIVRAYLHPIDIVVLRPIRRRHDICAF